ncbi:MAG: DinB superfamily protein [Chlorobi bacterium OLB5]|nr:MAG: DinB superfamily protein [Chlorobi bacterium OLB5]
MKLSEINPKPEYFDRYMHKCDDVDIISAISTSIKEVEQIPLDKWKAIGLKTYAPGKWTISDIVQHLIDAERIFIYRALSIARGEKQPLPPFSENDYVTEANASARDLDSLIAELKNLHISLLDMYSSFSQDILMRRGKSFAGEYTVADIGFIIPGHQRWHFEVIRDKYIEL